MIGCTNDSFTFQKGDTVKPNYNSVDLAEVELAEASEMVRFKHDSIPEIVKSRDKR